MKRWSKQSLPESLVRALRLGRQAAYLLCAPLDYAHRLVNGKGDLPPLHLRRYVGPLRSFESSGAEFVAYLRLLCRLQPHERLLDIGCGCRLMALPLLDYLTPPGGYDGVDIHRPSIQWCRRNITPRHPHFTFRQIDVYSHAYNPQGRQPAAGFRFPFEDATFDVVLLKSVFTHMLPAEVDNYLKEISRLLSTCGRALLTFFLLNERQRELASEGANNLRFDFGEEGFRYVYEHSPESAVAYEERLVLELLRKHRLKLREPVLYGNWSGRADGLSFQDMLVVEKE